MAQGLLKAASKTIAAAQDAATVTGFPGRGSVAVQVTGTLSATISFEATVDGSTWVAFNMTPSNSGTDASSTTAAGAWTKDIGAYAGVRARCSAYTSGSPVVTVRFAGA